MQTYIKILDFYASLIKIKTTPRIFAFKRAYPKNGMSQNYVKRGLCLKKVSL